MSTKRLTFQQHYIQRIDKRIVWKKGTYQQTHTNKRKRERIIYITISLVVLMKGVDGLLKERYCFTFLLFYFLIKNGGFNMICAREKQVAVGLLNFPIRMFLQNMKSIFFKRVPVARNVDKLLETRY